MGYLLICRSPAKLMNTFISCKMSLTYLIVHFSGFWGIGFPCSGKNSIQKAKNQICKIVTARSALHGFITSQNPRFSNFLFRQMTCTCVCVLSCVWLFVIPWTVTLQGPLSMEFSRQESWSRLLFPTPGDLSDPGIKPTSLSSPALADSFTTVPPGKP